MEETRMTVRRLGRDRVYGLDEEAQVEKRPQNS